MPDFCDDKNFLEYKKIENFPEGGMPISFKLSDALREKTPRPGFALAHLPVHFFKQNLPGDFPVRRPGSLPWSVSGIPRASAAKKRDYIHENNDSKKLTTDETIPGLFAGAAVSASIAAIFLFSSASQVSVLSEDFPEEDLSADATYMLAGTGAGV